MSCVACHRDGFGPRNQYGTAINLLLTGNDRDDAARKREAGRRVSDIPANPSLLESPTFGDLIQQDFLPALDLTSDLPAFRKLPVKPSEQTPVERARELVQQVQEESRFGILQLSQTYEMNQEAAAALAQFRGEMLILGGPGSSVLLPAIKTLSVEQAKEIIVVNRLFFLEGTVLPLSVITEEVAAVFAENPALGGWSLGASVRSPTRP